LMKNYSMIGLATGEANEEYKRAGELILTDPDFIENSNLTR
jgi:hypothetical protein